jgi:hypothetical protein
MDRTNFYRLLNGTVVIAANSICRYMPSSKRGILPLLPQQTTAI